MNIKKNEFEILSYIEREGGQKLPQRKIADDTSLSLGMVNKSLAELGEMGLVRQTDKKELQITKLGMEALEPYRVKRAVIIAAGFGSRMVPITLNTPKPLVRVHGKMIIETLLDAIVEAGIPEIVVVRGYLWEQFDSLLHKYPQIRFVYNPLFNESNNISSAYLAKDLLQNAYVCEADLLLSNPRLIRKYEYSSNYLGMFKEYTDDWCFEVKRGKIRQLMVGGRDCYHMYGISYWDQKDGAQLCHDLEETFQMPGGKEKYWDEVALRVFSKNYAVDVRPCFEGDIVEIDTFNELKQIDPVYNM
ncbi:NTP transferase domain-containing protein [Bittarella massiliensis (ex Durand et al. 2017)]|uniref:NTP transferase domain-containing protein n=1 Tax=Bittarella massiliensis (ex Durand et al. 2017) TaxID=1720313 RepID=UPI001AA10AC9|nr:NTP transferase domain-containing protein [Bittarella massiliensis (ex Durand et al. 2017)]MBO1678660.1 NTP transferase domain-containing protein [Bittarella massiliensis (ex Durand et al. 2017)]